MVAPAALRRFRHNVIVICVPKYGDDLGDAGYGQEFGRECSKVFGSVTGMVLVLVWILG